MVEVLGKWDTYVTNRETIALTLARTRTRTLSVTLILTLTLTRTLARWDHLAPRRHLPL